MKYLKCPNNPPKNRKDETEEQKKTRQNNKMVGLKLNISISLNINGINTPLRRSTSSELTNIW